MDYHVVDPFDLEPLPDRSATAYSITEAADLSSLGMRYYEAAPGEQIPLVYHYHERQEEVFYVVDGTLHVETPERVYTVDAGEAFVAKPGNPHRAHNPEGSDGSVRVLAVGCPTGDSGVPYEE